MVVLAGKPDAFTAGATGKAVSGASSLIPPGDIVTPAGPASLSADPTGYEEVRAAVQGRTAVERVNARLKVFWGADDGNVTGATRFYALLGTVMVVHVAFATLLATAPRWEGTLGHTRLSPIAKALERKLSG